MTGLGLRLKPIHQQTAAGSGLSFTKASQQPWYQGLGTSCKALKLRSCDCKSRLLQPAAECGLGLYQQGLAWCPITRSADTASWWSAADNIILLLVEHSHILTWIQTCYKLFCLTLSNSSAKIQNYVFKVGALKIINPGGW